MIRQSIWIFFKDWEFHFFHEIPMKILRSIFEDSIPCDSLTKKSDFITIKRYIYIFLKILKEKNILFFLKRNTNRSYVLIILWAQINIVKAFTSESILNSKRRNKISSSSNYMQSFMNSGPWNF